MPPTNPPLLYAELARGLEESLAQGTLRPGQRLPSVRRMSHQRGVSISTVLQAYGLLENRGWIEARPQSGYYVRPRLPSETPEPRMARPMARPSHVGVGGLAAEVLTLAANREYLPLGAAGPHHSLFPTRKLARILGAVAREDPALLGRDTLGGACDPLTREIARRYCPAGCTLDPEELVVTIGGTEAIHLALRAVTRPGDTVAVETPADFGFLETIQSLGLRVVEVPADPRTGLSVEATREALSGHAISALIVTPSFANPLGSCMPDEHKEKLYRLLAEFDVPAIEDDRHGELHFNRRRPKPLKAWDTDGRVLLCSSFGKTLAPSLRVGWCAPGRHLGRVRRLKLASTLGTPVILQKTIAEFLRDGGYDHHLRSLRRACQNQLQLFAPAILRHFPAGTRLSRPEGGFVLWIELPTDVDALHLHRDALKQRIATAPGPLFSVKDRYRNCLRMNCGLPWNDAIESALGTLGDLAKRQL
jgi:DNA-binding transcriptional MocR family regulator